MAIICQSGHYKKIVAYFLYKKIGSSHRFRYIIGSQIDLTMNQPTHVAFVGQQVPRRKPRKSRFLHDGLKGNPPCQLWMVSGSGCHPFGNMQLCQMVFAKNHVKLTLDQPHERPHPPIGAHNGGKRRTSGEHPCHNAGKPALSLTC